MPVYIFVVLTVHECGHYFAARFFNISVDSFSLGYGREVWARTDARGTRWGLRIFPICGHVNLSAEKPVSGRTLFNAAPIWQRFTVVAAGPAVNIILAFLVLFAFFAFFGQPSKQPVISGVEPGEAAYQAGLQTGDRILGIAGQPVVRYRDVWHHTWNRPGEALDLTVQRGDEVFHTTLVPSFTEYTDGDGINRAHGRMAVMIGRSFYELTTVRRFNGIDVTDEPDKVRDLILANLGRPVTLGLKSTDGETHDYETILDPDFNAHLRDPDHSDYGSFYAGTVKDNFYLPRTVTQSLIEGGKQTGVLVANIARVPFQLFPVDKDLVQPWALVKSDDMFAERKLYEFIYRIALVSIFIALLNLVPFPGMDGSMLLLLLIDAVMGPANPQRQRVYKYALLTSLCVLYGSVLAANVHDFPRFVEMKVASIGKTES